MKTVRVLLTAVIIMSTECAWAQSQPQAQPQQKKDLSPEEIIKAFSTRETEFYEAWKEYSYHQTADVEVLSVNGRSTSEKMKIISDIVFRDDGTREVRIVRRAGDLQSVTFTREDEEVIDNLQPFALTEKELALYDLQYEGKERVDELSCYVFSVKPKNLKGPKLYFQGKIWVDDQDLQIVRTVGKPVPQKKNTQFPDFETIRQVIDNKYWFPVWTHALSDLHFERQTVRIEETISYTNYKHFASKATIKFGTPQP